jgi:hypothetical protein
MIDGAQKVTRVILRQVAVNTPELDRNVYIGTYDAVSIVFVLMCARAYCHRSISLS